MEAGRMIGMKTTYDLELPEFKEHPSEKKAEPFYICQYYIMW
jgi:hypothetical protein